MKRPLWMALTITALFSLTSANLRADGRILASGPPPLTADMVTREARFFEWALDVAFSPAHMQEFERMQVRDWSDTSKRQSALTLLKTLDKLEGLPADKRNQVQAELNRSLLKQIRSDSQDADSRWMLAIYEAAHSPSTAPVASVAAPTGGASENKRLTGKWRSGSVAMTQYRNATTGAPAPTSGSHFVYDFHADGTYNFNGLMQITTYGCTSMIYRDIAGTYRTEGNRLYTQPTRGMTKSQVCGGTMKEKADDLKLSTQVFRFETDSSGTENLVITDEAGTSRPDYFRRQKD